MENKSSASGGISFCGLLTIAFIVLKLCGVISWSWFWVLSPILIPLIILLVVLMVFLIPLVVGVITGFINFKDK